MKTALLGCVAAMTMGIAAASAQSTNNAPATDNGAAPAFVDRQETGTLRAPKLVGVAVYDSNNKSVGKIDDLLLDKEGNVKTVVIGVGGFLGIGKKDVAVPYSAIKWQTEERSVAVNDTSPAGSAAGGASPAAKPMEKKVDATATETYQGYPDRAIITASQDQLKAAPEFKYASNPQSTASASPGSAAPGDTTAPAAKQ